MSRRTVAGLLALGLAAVLLAVVVLQPVPYSALTPGPTFDALHRYNDNQVIKVTGHKVYPDNGKLLGVTVYETGPDQKLTLLEVFSDWVAKDASLLPHDALYHPTDTSQSVRQQSALQMTTSQDSATVAALTAAGIAFKTIIEVGAVDPKGGSAGVLKVHDELIKVNGTEVTGQQSVTGVIRPLKPGSKVTLLIRRQGVLMTVTVTANGGQLPEPALSGAENTCPTGAPVPTVNKQVSLIGITPAPRYVYPFNVKVDLGDDIGGPSAGMMFALTMYDLLTPGSLTGGNVIAGSGEINLDSTVGPIGGIGQKIAAAQRDGARLFLVASENWHEAIGSNYDKSKIRLARVHTLADAITAVNTWRANPNAALPGCAG
jgi:PDZ domain-containing protein